MGRKTWNTIILASAALAATVVAGPVAIAHDGHHEQMALAEQVRHLLSQPDHLLGAAALIVLAIAGGWSWRRTTARK